MSNGSAHPPVVSSPASSVGVTGDLLGSLRGSGALVDEEDEEGGEATKRAKQLVRIELRPCVTGERDEGVHGLSVLRRLEKEGVSQNFLSSEYRDQAAALLDERGWNGEVVVFPIPRKRKGRDDLVHCMARNEDGSRRNFIYPLQAPMYEHHWVILGFFE